jgi:myxalamid-type polyketide synthase MxaE and MxaD
MLRPKVSGTWVLHALTREGPLDFFVMFSSTTGLLGSSMLGHYAAANTFLDTFAHYRRSHQLPAVAVNWGVWDEMRATSDYQARVAQGGLLPLATARALEAFGLMLGAKDAQITVASADWTMLKSVYEAKRRRPFLERLGSRPAPRTAGAREADLLTRLEAARRTERHGLLVDFVRRAASQVLALPAAEIEVDRGLFDLGMDSLMSVDLKTRLESGIGRSLPSTLAFNHPTVGALVAYIEKQLPQLFASVEAEPASEPVSHEDTEDDDLSEDELAALLADRLARVQ